jgi:hypothetical protein
MAEEPLIFLACIIIFFIPRLLKRILSDLQILAGIVLVITLITYHDDPKIIFYWHLFGHLDQ